MLIGIALPSHLERQVIPLLRDQRDQKSHHQKARKSDDIDDFTKRYAGKVTILPLDVTSSSSIKEAHDTALAHVGRIDVLVNNAGYGVTGAIEEVTEDEYMRMFNTNVFGLIELTKAFLPEFRAQRSGHIVNISSLAGKNALPNGAAYAASKWGLNGLTYSVAEELRPHNIRVSTVCPGSVDTELSPHAGKDPAKMLQSNDIAHAVAMLVTQAPQSFMSEILIRPTQKP